MSEARVKGVDVDAAAITAALANRDAVDNVEFSIHDAREPLPAGSRYDVVVMWMVLLYLPDKAASRLKHRAGLPPTARIAVETAPAGAPPMHGGYQPTAISKYCGLPWEMNVDWPLTSSYGKPYANPLMALSCQNLA